VAAYYNENDRFAAAWLRELIRAGHVSAGEVDERSIVEIQPSDLKGFTQCHFFAGIGVWSYALRNAGWPDDSPVWTGSCPCQSFSQSGQRGGFDDPRHLWPAWFRLIAERRPHVVFGEQVASGDGLAWLDVVCADLEGAGYAVGAADLCAAGFGAPHIRQRLYFVADASSSTRQRRAGGVLGAEAPSSGERVEHGNLPVGFADGGEADGLADADLAGKYGRALEGLAGHGDDGDQPGRLGAGATRSIAEAGPVNGFWRNAEWLECADGVRPAEPGTFPLAYGVAARMGRLRGFGNAIVAPVAEGFVRAYMETRP
jgi:DNA (cytosine-5)-methyltransferase 1